MTRLPSRCAERLDESLSASALASTPTMDSPRKLAPGERAAGDQKSEDLPPAHPSVTLREKTATE
jgi:hypothetical protein